MAQLAEFIGNHLLLSMAFIVVLFLLISMQMSEKMQAFGQVNPAELTQLVNQKKAVLIDTRSTDEYKSGHIVNAINMPLADLVTGKSNLSKLKGKPVIAYCIRGMSSKSACKYLLNTGIENVFSLSGGINAWKSEKLPLVEK